MELTPARITYDGVDLGGSLSNVKINVKYMKADIMADQLGKSVLDRVVSGIEATIETELTEIKNKATWKVVFPNADKVTSGPNSTIVWRSKIGSHDLDLAKVLIIHPLSAVNGNLAQDVKAPLAVASEESGFEYGPDKQATLKIVWNVYLDTSSNPAVLLIYGDPSIGIIPASAAAPVYVGTGNGTVTAVAPASDAPTETISVLCLGDNGADTGIFSVSGSVSGPLGTATLPGTPGGSVLFTSSVMSFTITDGTIDFVEGDLFTIAVTGANYS
jgi:hypothetical protein